MVCVGGVAAVKVITCLYPQPTKLQYHHLLYLHLLYPQAHHFILTYSYSRVLLCLHLYQDQQAAGTHHHTACSDLSMNANRCSIATTTYICLISVQAYSTWLPTKILYFICTIPQHDCKYTAHYVGHAYSCRYFCT